MLLPLLWKDIRLNKYVMLLTVFLVDTPYVTTAFGLSAFTGDPETQTDLTERLTIAFPFSLFFVALASAFIGGSPIAAEKAEQTDRFLDYLPPTRRLVVISKFLIAMSLLALAWIGPLIVYFAWVRPGGRRNGHPRGAQHWAVLWPVGQPDSVRPGVAGLGLYPLVDGLWAGGVCRLAGDFDDHAQIVFRLPSWPGQRDQHGARTAVGQHRDRGFGPGHGRRSGSAQRQIEVRRSGARPTPVQTLPSGVNRFAYYSRYATPPLIVKAIVTASEIAFNAR